MLTHNSTTSKNEPSWSEVDQGRTPRNSFADMAEPNDPSTWKYCHHWTQDPVIGPSGRYTRGQQFLHQEGLKIALSETRRLDKDNNVRAHLLAHAKAIGIKDTQASSVMQGHSKSQTEQTESKALSVSHSMTDFSLRGVAEAITNCESLESLTAIENECLLHFSQAEKSGKSWVVKDRAQSMAGQVSQLVALRRRQVLSMPEIQKEKELYNLGRAIGKGGI